MNGYPFIERTFGPSPECEEVGMSGGCGKLCPVYQEGNCEAEEEIMAKDDEEFAKEIGKSMIRRLDESHDF